MMPQNDSMNDLLTGGEIDSTEAEALQAAIATYRTESLLWAQRRSAAMPSLAPAVRRARLWAVVPQWSLAAVAAITVAVGIANVRNTSQQPAPAVEASAVVTPATPQQIADDNTLLHQIDAAVNAGSDLPVDSLGLQVKTPMAPGGSTE